MAVAISDGAMGELPRSTNYVDARTPEERAADAEMQKTVVYTTSTPTTPSWEEEFDARKSLKHKNSFLDYGDDDCPPEINWENIKAFIRSEIEASYERGRGQRENFTTMRLTAYNRGRADVTAEIEAQLPPNKERHFSMWFGADPEPEVGAWNDFRTAVLAIIQRSKEK